MTIAAEICLNAHLVIGARLPIVASALAIPERADVGELTRMVTEKIDAYGRSGNRFARSLLSVNGALVQQAYDVSLISSNGSFDITAWLPITHQALHICSMLSRLPGEILQPIRVRTAANARRLRVQTIFDHTRQSLPFASLSLSGKA